MTYCAFCDSSNMSEVMDFGNVALAGAFLRPDEFAHERKYPLRLCYCADCFALQVVDRVSAKVLFNEYFYFSSSIRTLRQHFQKYAVDITSRFLPEPESSVSLEFGCNDGILLRPMADQNVGTVIGVDPATNVVRTIDDPRVTVINDFFTEKVAEGVVERHGKVDLVLANNVYAHIPAIRETTRAVERVLKDDGVFVFEVHYLGKLIDEVQYDMIYHEHLYYYSLLSATEHFERYDMLVFDVEPVPIHAGSMRFYVCKRGGKHSSEVSPRATALRNEELAKGFHRRETFSRFAETVRDRKERLMELLERLGADGKRVAGYGASGRANTIIQYCGIDDRHIEYMIDDAPAKAGYFTPGSHFCIHPSSILDNIEDRPDYLLVFAWSFLDEIIARNQHYLEGGGGLIIPLPEVRVIPSQSIQVVS